MKKVLSLLGLLLLILAVSVGCSSSNTEGNGNTDTDPGITQPETDDISKGFTYTVEDGDLNLTYNNTGNTVTLIKATERYDYYVYTSEGAFTNHNEFSEVIKAQMSETQPRIYFSIELIHGIGITTYFIELETMEISFIGQGTFVQEILFDINLSFAVLEDPWSSYLAFYTDANGGGQYYYLGERLEDDIKEQLDRAMSGNFDDKEPPNLSNLTDGDYVGAGLTIDGIYYDKDYGEAFFNLVGEIRLTGVAEFSEWTNAVSFELTEYNLPVILIERPDGTIYTHEIETLYFRYCPSDRLSNFYGQLIEITIEEIYVDIEFLYEARNYIIELIDFTVLD